MTTRCRTSRTAGYQPAGARATSPRRQVAGAPAAKLAAVQGEGRFTPRVVVLLLLLAACMRSVPKKETRQADAVAEKRGIVGGLINQVAAPPPPTAHYAPIAENGFMAEATWKAIAKSC